MNDYLQPGFYRFNSDSLELVKWILPQIKKCHSLLDLGAGCGIIGLELVQKIPTQQLVLLEGQEDFKPYLTHNLCFLPSNTACELVFQKFSQWNPSKKFDLIVCNPPYYLPGRGESSTDPRRGMARSFIHDDWAELLGAIEKSLASDGRAYLVIKNRVEIVNEIRRVLKASSLRSRSEEKDDLIFWELFRLNVN